MENFCYYHILRCFRFYFVVCCHVKVENDDDLDFVDEMCVDVSRRMIEY